LEEVIVENHKKYLERIKLYKSFGYDVEKERSFIIECAQPLYGDILEIGTGKGYFAVALARQGYSFISVDVSDKEQKFARLNAGYFNLGKQIDFRIEDAQRLSFENNSFDIIFSVNMVHHLTNPSKVIDELIRVVSFEGKIILSDFSKEGLEVVDQVHKSEGRKHGTTQTTLAEIEKYLLNKSFKIEKQRDKFQEIVIAYHQLI